MPSPHPSRALRRLLLVPAAFALFLAGCTKTTSQVGQKAQEQPKDEPQLAADVGGRVRDIIGKVQKLQETSSQLPGDTADEHRRLMHESFAALTQILPLMEGDQQSGEFRQGLRILDSSRQQLAGASKGLAVEPTVGQGLRAAVRLIGDVNRVVFNNDAQITKSLDGLQQRVDELDSVHGPLNRVVASQSMRQTAALLQQMSATLAERAGVESKPAAAPAAKPDAAGAAALQ